MSPKVVYHDRCKENEAYLEGVEVGVAVKVHLRRDPLPRTLVLLVKTHEEHGIDRVDNRVANSARVCKVCALLADGVVLVVTHSVALYSTVSGGLLRL